ncbi:N-acetylmannosaminyltransferase [Sporolactobacillus inulinus]|uniref:N-acetylmannosaminyltransferase n=1 Tax=Sporolactobacillus inulinus TaxID=2078 RepID=A0A4Y1ZAX0_9BACL|nr:WecB/TagA/CpsF family glycosyltransferase [Sporolactobacillus inulinus]GAY76212.1 N-acetylmannosaminyltransferase [Sporolactobacillus inulinus]
MNKPINSHQQDKNKKFEHQVDNNEIPFCNILGVNIAAINMSWLLDYLEKNIRDLNGNLLSGEYICVSNVHTTIMSYESKEYRSIQNNGLMAIPDGGPLSTIGHMRGHCEMKRTTGPSLMKELFNRSVKYGYRHYFYGSTLETLEKMKKRLEVEYPGIQVVGMYSPPFRSLTDEENDTVVKIINGTKPDIIWVGLGAPKQEMWMAEHRRRVRGLMIGVGAGFDYFAGNIERAPMWMQNCNLEWLYRLIQDPKRLFRRYMRTNIKFLWLALLRGK